MPDNPANTKLSDPGSLNPERGLRHQLTAGQMTMVAVGGSIGTGLLLGTAAAIELAGPAVILSFVLAAFISWTVALALGELASTHPAAGSFGVYGDLYLNHWAGFISRAGYWLAIAVSIGAEMVASATYMQLWFPHVPALVWVLVFSVFLLGMNFLSVHSYGRFEFWFAMIKVAVIAAFIVLGAILLLGGRAVRNIRTTADFSLWELPRRFWPSPSPSIPSAGWSLWRWRRASPVPRRLSPGRCA